MQQILKGIDSLDAILQRTGISRYMLVCDSAFPYLPIKGRFSPKVTFDQFTSNPLYEDVCRGVEIFNSNNCDAIVAVGGGSTIDVAKCIKLYCRMDSKCNYLEQECFDSRIPIVAIPTTAGTGSESTRYAVIYYKGTKQSVTHSSIIPDYAILEHECLRSLPPYQKKCTLLDALSQAIESWWSINSNDKSIDYSRQSIELIVKYLKRYLFNYDEEAADAIMTAANLSGQAINITQTTAPHAMSYKLTSMYGLPHGHAVAICLPEVWKYMTEHMNECVDERGQSYLEKVFDNIAKAMSCHTVEEAILLYKDLLEEMSIKRPISETREADISCLTVSVNPVRLKNNPVRLTEASIRNMYNNILL